MKTTLLVITIALLSISAYADSSKTSKNVKTTKTEVFDNANSVDLSGIITDKKSHELLAGARIFIDGTKYYSDLDGNFTIELIENVFTKFYFNSCNCGIFAYIIVSKKSSRVSLIYASNWILYILVEGIN
jgi:hypothetical protein